MELNAYVQNTGFDTNLKFAKFRRHYQLLSNAIVNNNNFTSPYITCCDAEFVISLLRDWL